MAPLPRVDVQAYRLHARLRGRATDGDGVEWWGLASRSGRCRASSPSEGRRSRGTLPSSPPRWEGGSPRARGNGGALWSPAIGKVRTFDLRTRQGKTWPRKPPPDFFSDGRHVVLSVELLPVPNVPCLREAFDVTTEEDMRRFLAPTTHLRILFVDRWEAMPSSGPRVDADSSPSLPDPSL